MELIDRIKYLMKLNNLSASAFAEKVGVQPSSISHILSGRNKPSLEFIQKVLNHFPKVSADWLISGKKTVEEKPFPTPAEKTKPEPTPIQNSEHPPTPPESSSSNPTVNQFANSNSKHVQKIIILYSDNTFEEILK